MQRRRRGWRSSKVSLDNETCINEVVENKRRKEGMVIIRWRACTYRRELVATGLISFGFGVQFVALGATT